MSNQEQEHEFYLLAPAINGSAINCFLAYQGGEDGKMETHVRARLTPISSELMAEIQQRIKLLGAGEKLAVILPAPWPLPYDDNSPDITLADFRKALAACTTLEGRAALMQVVVVGDIESLAD